MSQPYYLASSVTDNIRFLWVASTVGKLILAKMWLFVHHPRLLQVDPECEAQLKKQIFQTSIEVIEFGLLLMKTRDTAKWAWLFKTYMQWHAVAYVLSELCHMPNGPESERAWQAIDSVYDKNLIAQAKGYRGVLWRPLKQLHARALAHRKEQKHQLSQNSKTVLSPNSDRSGSVSSEPYSTPGNMKDNWLGGNPYLNAVSASGDMFGLDLSDPVFNEVNLYGLNGHGMTDGQMQMSPTESLPYGWTPGVLDYNMDVQGQQPNGWVPMQQEWH